VVEALVVDDEAEWRELLEEALVGAGYHVVTFGDGWKAIQAMEDHQPDFVVLDVRMNPTGAEVLGAIRERWPELPVIMVSSHWGRGEDPDVLEASGFVEKVLDPGILGGRLHKAFLRAVE
jgi:CheY-like chemotaxis protein